MKYRLTAAPLPATFSGTQQELMDAIIARLEISSDAEPFSSSETAPAGNAGPWFKNGTDLYVWDENTSAYIPLDLTASFIPQIFAGTTAPDPTVYPLWLKLSGVTIVGLFYYHEGTTAWISDEIGLADGSVGTTELAVGAVTSQNIELLAVTNDKLDANIGMTKWEIGGARTFARMNAAGTAIEWRQTQFVSPDISLPDQDPNQAAQMAVWLHGLGVVPHDVSVSLVYAGDIDWFGYTAGDEIEMDMALSSYVGNAIQKTINYITCHGTTNTPILCPADGAWRTIGTGWFMRIRCTTP